jgi:hypothetical protein
MKPPSKQSVGKQPALQERKMERALKVLNFGKSGPAPVTPGMKKE